MAPVRLIQPADLPPELWSPTLTGGRLSPPKALSKAYRAVLTRLGLSDRAVEEHAVGAIGGESEEATDKHFAERFSGSCGRTQLAVLDPKEELGATSDTLVKAAAGGQLAVLDVPSGCGAGAATLLAAVAELRRAGVVPRHPLEVTIVGGDVSQRAGLIAGELLTHLHPALRRQGVFVRLVPVVGDLLDAKSTTALVERWADEARRLGCTRRLVLIANCSGFMANKVNEAKERLGEVFRRAELEDAALIWVEPQTKKAGNMFKSMVKKLVGLAPPPLPAGDVKDAGPLLSNAVCGHLLDEAGEHEVRLALHRLHAR